MIWFDFNCGASPPAHSMIDPVKDGEALKREVRSGFKSWGEAVRELGRDPETVLEEVAEWNRKFDDAKVSFDSDPRRMSNVGFAQAGDSLDKLGKVANPTTDEGEDSEDQNETDAPEESDSGVSE